MLTPKVDRCVSVYQMIRVWLLIVSSSSFLALRWSQKYLDKALLIEVEEKRGNFSHDEKNLETEADCFEVSANRNTEMWMDLSAFSQLTLRLMVPVVAQRNEKIQLRRPRKKKKEEVRRWKH